MPRRDRTALCVPSRHESTFVLHYNLLHLKDNQRKRLPIEHSLIVFDNAVSRLNNIETIREFDWSDAQIRTNGAQRLPPVLWYRCCMYQMSVTWSRV